MAGESPGVSQLAPPLVTRGVMSYIESLRQMIEEQYSSYPTGCGGSFGELLCYELHMNGLAFRQLADKWRVSLPTLGELIWDHCKRLEELPNVDHKYRAC